MRDWMFTVTVGPWAHGPGFSAYPALRVWRLNLGFVAFALVEGDLMAFAARTGEAAKAVKAMKEVQAWASGGT